jgi:hypothetical protein
MLQGVVAHVVHPRHRFDLDLFKKRNEMPTLLVAPPNNHPGPLSPVPATATTSELAPAQAIATADGPPPPPESACPRSSAVPPVLRPTTGA